MGVMMEWPRALKGGWGLEEVLVCDPTPCNGVNSQHPPLRTQPIPSIDISIYNSCIYDIDVVGIKLYVITPRFLLRCG